MGQQDSERTSHDNDVLPTTFRNADLANILNDANEEESGKGFSEVSRSGNFVDKITVWDSPSKNFKRTETNISRVSNLVSTITKDFYSLSGSIVATITATVSRNPNKSISNIDTVITRS